jgi:hypothetical protein
MTQRRTLPQRRHSETFELAFGGFDKKHIITVGYYDDGTVGEVFINFPKSGMPTEAIARDGAVLLSLALQYGATLENMKSAITRNSNGEPSTVVGAVIDRLIVVEAISASSA